MSCERFLALGQRRAGAERVNPLPDAVPSSRPLHTARARAALWDAVGRRARSRLAAWTRSFSVRTGVPFFVGSPPKRGSPVPLFVRLVPTTRYKESSWVPWSGCIVVNPFLDIHISQSLPSPPSKRKLNTAAVLRRVTASDSCISYNHSSAVQSDCISATDTCCIYSVASKQPNMPRALLLVAYLATSDALVAPLRRDSVKLAEPLGATKLDAAAVEGEESRPKTPPLGAKLVLPGDEDLNYGTTIVSCALASFLMLTAALPSDWQAPPANSREARAVKVATLLKQNKKLAKKDGRVVEVAGELSAFDKAEAFALPALGLFVVAPLLVQGRNLKQIYDYSRTEEILRDSRDGGRKYSAEASRSLGTSLRKWLGFEN